ncbi:MAG: hypothetical protein CL724_00905 [Chloroflexi bacterium]|jgi:hypothetical protein|nr:hypothetical protein [Chloroflexota bacterium]
MFLEEMGRECRSLFGTAYREFARFLLNHRFRVSSYKVEMKGELVGPVGSEYLADDLRIKRQCLDQLRQSRCQFKTSVKLQVKRRLRYHF